MRVLKRARIIAIVAAMVVSMFTVGFAGLTDDTNMQDWAISKGYAVQTTDTAGDTAFSKGGIPYRLSGKTASEIETEYAEAVKQSSSGVPKGTGNGGSVDETKYNEGKNDASAAQGKLADIQVTADTESAWMLVHGFEPILSILVGVVAVLVTMFMTVYTSFDIAYIAFPVFRNKCEEAKVSGNGPLASKKSNGEAKLRFVSDDAQYVVKECATANDGRSPWGMYLKMRMVSFVLVAIVMFILLTGRITLITNIALKAVDGIMGVLNSLGAQEVVTSAPPVQPT